MQDLVAENAELKSRIAELEEQLVLAKLDKAGLSGAGQGAIDQIKKAALDEIRQERAKREKLEHALRDYAPIEIIKRPRSFSDDAIHEMLSTRSDLVMTTWDDSCMVGYSVAIRFGPEDDDFIVGRGWGTFSGSSDEAEREIKERIDPLIRRAPFPETRGSAGLVGVSDEQIAQSLLKLAPCRYDPNRLPDWDTMLGNIFEQDIWPIINQSDLGVRLGKNEARNRFRKEAHRRFEKVEADRGITPPRKHHRKAKKP